MRYLSLFSGIEAATVAWEPLGWQPAAFAEIDPFASAVLAHHYPDVPNLGDVTKANFDEIGSVDAMVFGSPCQSYSVGGRRLGLADPRGNLALIAGGVVYRKQPRWFVFENVPGLLSTDHGRDFGTLLAAYAGHPAGSVFSPPDRGWKNSGAVVEAEGGYGLAWRVCDAQNVHVDGYEGAVPQHRERLFVVGYLGDWRRAVEVLFDGESLQRNHPPRSEAWKAAAVGAAGGGGIRGEGDAGSDHRLGNPETSALIKLPVSATVTSKWSKGTGGPSGDECQNLVAFSTSGKGYWHAGVGPLRAGENKSHESVVVGVVANTMTARIGRARGAANIDGPALVAHSIHAAGEPGWAVRRLMPVECERLQGFKAGYTAIPLRNKKGVVTGKLAADGPRYKAIGNSMAVNVMRWMGRRIAMVDASIALEHAA